MRVAHLALDLGLGRERGDRVDNDDVDGAGSNQHVGDFQRLFAGIGLGDEQVVDVHTQCLGVARIERVLGVNEGGRTTDLLRLGDGVQRQRRLARRFRPVYLDDTAPGKTADAQRDIQRQRSGRDHRHILAPGVVAHAHDRALAVLLFDLAQCRGQCSLAIVVHDSCPLFSIRLGCRDQRDYLTALS